MGISLMSALMIQGDDTYVGVYSNKEKTGYGFVVYLMKRGEIHTEIVSTIPNVPFMTEEEAQTAGDELVSQVRGMDLSSQRSKLEDIMGPETKKAVSEVVTMANNPNPNP